MKKHKQTTNLLETMYLGFTNTIKPRSVTGAINKFFSHSKDHRLTHVEIILWICSEKA